MYGSIVDQNETNCLFYYGGHESYWNMSINMAFGFEPFPPSLKIVVSPFDPEDVWLIPSISSKSAFSIWWNPNAVDYDHPSWNLLGNYPAGTSVITDTGTLAPPVPKQKFYLLKKE